MNRFRPSDSAPLVLDSGWMLHPIVRQGVLGAFLILLGIGFSTAGVRDAQRGVMISSARYFAGDNGAVMLLVIGGALVAAGIALMLRAARLYTFRHRLVIDRARDRVVLRGFRVARASDIVEMADAIIGPDDNPDFSYHHAHAVLRSGTPR
jgi:hypothetical protein